MIITYLMALVPSFVIELKTRENITNGNEKISNSLMVKLIEYKKDLKAIGIIAPKYNENNNAPRNTRGILKFLMEEFI
jgi:hypothetical protein